MHFSYKWNTGCTVKQAVNAKCLWCFQNSPTVLLAKAVAPMLTIQGVLPQAPWWKPGCSLILPLPFLHVESIMGP